MVEPLDGEGIAARCASPLFRSAAFYPQAATVQPARLVEGLRDRLLDGRRPDPRGLPGPLADRRGRRRWSRRRARATVTAGAAVLAAGGSLLRFRPLRRALTATSSHMVITEPVPELLESLGWTGGECITDSRAMVHYFRTTRDGRIAFGWGGGRVVRGARIHGHAEVDAAMAREVEAHLRRFFPARRRARDARVGRADRRLADPPAGDPHASASAASPASATPATGSVPRRWSGGRWRRWRSASRDEYTLAARSSTRRAVQVPPEPFRYAGGTIIRRAILRKELAEEEDRIPGRITSMVSGIPERLGIHVGR